MSAFHYLLSPIKLSEEEHKAYHAVKELEAILNKEDCRNIALTGTFGSGKSSILKTFRECDSQKEKQFLNISLATLDGAQREIEYSILQQLIYKADASKLAQSRLKKIRHIDTRRQTTYALFALGFILAFFVAVEPTWLRVDTFYDPFHFAPWINLGADILAVAYMFFCLFFVIKHAVKQLYNSKLHKLNFKDGSIEISETASVFNQHLDEVVYFFEATQYDVVIFEDLDRFKDPREVFLKLREINAIINDCSSRSQKSKSPTRFIYAIKDEIFTGEERTKYFDYIVSAIPVVNALNSGDYLIKTYGSDARFKGIDRKHWIELGAYIGGMRELLNIINEFEQYKAQIGEKLEDHKLFAITIYKNKYPEDYAKLHLKTGALYRSIKAKGEYVILATEELRGESESLLKKQQNTRKEITTIREKYITALQGLISDCKGVMIDGHEYALAQIVESDSLFAKLAGDQIPAYYTEDAVTKEHTSYDLEVKFDRLESRIASGVPYARSVLHFEGELADIADRRESIESKRATISKSSLAKILDECEPGKVLEIICRKCKEEYPKQEPQDMELCRLILFMLRNGYIDEHYNSYISYFHPGSLSDADHDYFQNLTLGIASEYEYPLQSVANLIGMIPIEYYDKKITLNYCLVDGLLANTQECRNEIGRMIETIKRERVLDFIVGYEEQGKYAHVFGGMLIPRWDDYLHVAHEVEGEGLRTKLLLLFFKHCSPRVSDRFVDSVGLLSDYYDLLSKNLSSLNFNTLSQFLHNLDVKFKQIDRNEEAAKLYDFIADNSLYELNPHNLECIFGEEVNTKAYTTILSSGNKHATEYIKQNLERAVALFSESSTEETPEAIIALLNDDNLSVEMTKAYLSKQRTILDNLSGADSRYESILFDTDHVKPTWDNIINGYLHQEKKLTNSLKDYIIRNCDALEIEKVPFREDNPADLLFVSLFANNELPIDVYEALLSAFNVRFAGTDLSDLEDSRMSFLIQHDKLTYCAKNIQTLASNFSDTLFGDFLIENFEKYLSDQTNEIEMSGELGCHILDSTLTLEQKIRFLNQLSAELPDDKHGGPFADKICSQYAKAGVDDDSNLRVIDNALSRATNWRHKIRVINAINDSMGYNRDRMRVMLQTLGPEYVKLNELRKRPKFDNNEENCQLLTFLCDNGHIASWDVVNDCIHAVSLYQ